MKKTVPIRTEPEIQKLLRRLKEWNQNYYVAAAIGIHWGLRCSDILALQVGDVVAGEGKRVQIIDRIMIAEIKTGQERHILITDKMKDILHEHIRLLAKPLNMEVPLVLSRNHGKGGNGKPLSRQRLWAVLSQAAATVGIKGPIGTHSLRKTFAYQAWHNGTRIDVIQKVFGHASVATTHRYACIPLKEEDEVYQKINFGASQARRRPQNRNGSGR